MLILSNTYNFIAQSIPSGTTTPEEYYGNETMHGDYQFSTLTEIVDGLLMERLESDSYLKNTNRNLLLYHDKMEIKELTKRAATSRLMIEMTVGAEGYIVMPQDYVSYNRISLVVTDGATRRLVPLDINYNINTAIGYLQDNDAQILFDDDGNIITSDASNTYNMPYSSYQFAGSCLGNGGQPYLDASKFTEYGEFSVDEEKGRIVFSSNVIDKEVVVEYNSDGLQWEYFDESEIKIHKYFEEAVKDGTYFRCIEKRRTVPASEKTRAQNKYKTSRFIAIKKRAGLNLEKINRVMRSKTKY